jgi:hypothetical protein
MAVLGVEPIDVPHELAQQLTDALRDRAKALGGLKVVGAKDLIEIKMVFNCDGETPECMAQAGKSLGADKLLYGTLKKADGKGAAVVVKLKLLDVRTLVVERFVNETVNKRELAAGLVQKTASRWFEALVEADAKSVLTVVSDPPNAAVAVDGQPMGRTPVTLRDMPPGPHTVAVSMSGRQTVTKTVELPPFGSQEVLVNLPAEEPKVAKTEPTPPPPALVPTPEAQPIEPKKPKNTAGRAAFIAGAVTLAGALATGGALIYTWRTYEDLQGPVNQQLCTWGNGTFADGRCMNPGGNWTPEERDFLEGRGDKCNPPASFGSGQDVQSYRANCSEGTKMADASTGLWVVTGLLAAGGLTAILVGVHQHTQAGRAERPKSALAPSLRLRQSLKIAPILSTQGGALSASFEF